jgi:hypothetical protein
VIGPVSTTGRAMMASLQQAMAKGMPPDQAIQYVKSMAQQGIAPLADLYSMMMQFERLKQQKPQPPPAGTIRDQLNQMEQMQQMQAQAPINQGLGAVSAGAMENPQFAGGGIVAFQEGGGPADSKALEAEVLRILKKSPYSRTAEENALLQAAGIEVSRRTIGEPAKIPGADIIKRIIDPSDITGFTGVVGIEPPSAPAVAAAPTQSAIPTTASPFAAQAAPASFDQMLAGAQRGVPQDVAPAAPLAAGINLGIENASRGRDPFAALIEQVQGRTFQDLPDTFTPEERKRIEKDISKLDEDKQRAANMALAQAGFGMAAAASRSGRQRTSTLGALAEGALAGMQQYSANQKELRQTERELNREMRVLNQYADQVARGERTAKRDFEEDKQNRIADLTGKSETLKLQNAQLAQTLKLGMMQYGPTGTRADDAAYKNRVLEVEILKEQIDSIDKRLGSFQLSDAQRVQLEAERRQLVGQMNALRSSGGGAVAPTQSAIPDSILSLVNKYR